MNDVKALPCHRALDAECFRAYPAWARQALAYRLLHVFFPPWLTRRLPKFLRMPLIAPGVTIPTGAYLPPGSVVGPDTVFPPGWVSPDPPPDGVYIPPGTEFPPGWTPGDPLPTGVTMEPGAAFPPGWTPGDPYPEGVGLPAPLSELQRKTGVMPWIQGWITAGPLGRVPSETAEAGWSFYEPFDTGIGVFANLTTGDAEAVNDDGRLKLHCPTTNGDATVKYEFDVIWPTTYEYTFQSKCVSGSSPMSMDIADGNYYIGIGLRLDAERIMIYCNDGWHTYAQTIKDINNIYRLSVVNGVASFWREDTLLEAGLALYPYEEVTPYIQMQALGAGYFEGAGQISFTSYIRATS